MTRKSLITVCGIEGCGRPFYCKGFCVRHYQRLRIYGDPLQIHNGRDLSLIDRFTKRYRVDETTGCWLWTAGLKKAGGYGRFGVTHDLTTAAHRWSYEHFNGPIPAGYTVDHTCHNNDPTCPGGNTCLHRRCVNPAHLEAVTLKVNLLRGNTGAARNAAKTHCPQGHPYAGTNLFIDNRGSRICRTCLRDRTREANRRKRALHDGKGSGRV